VVQGRRRAADRRSCGHDGRRRWAIWLVEDRNKSILRIDVDSAASVGNALPCQ
jgi:hypothetical protein